MLEARRRSDGKHVAVKFLDIKYKRGWPLHPQHGHLPPDALVAMKMDHENIIKVGDMYEDDAYFYLVSFLLFGASASSCTRSCSNGSCSILYRCRTYSVMSGSLGALRRARRISKKADAP